MRLVNLVWENYLRNRRGLPPYLAVFAIDIDNNPYPVTPDSVATREASSNRRITHKELRVAYKLSFYPNIPKELQVMAHKTFAFVKTIKTPSTDLWTWELISSPWERAGWEEAWKTRMLTHKEKSERGFPCWIESLTAWFREEQQTLSPTA